MSSVLIANNTCRYWILHASSFGGDLAWNLDNSSPILCEPNSQESRPVSRLITSRFKPTFLRISLADRRQRTETSKCLKLCHKTDFWSYHILCKNYCDIVLKQENCRTYIESERAYEFAQWQLYLQICISGILRSEFCNKILQTQLFPEFYLRI